MARLFETMDTSNKPLYGFSVLSGLGDDSTDLTDMVPAGFTGQLIDPFAPAFSASNPTADQLVTSVANTGSLSNLPSWELLIIGAFVLMGIFELTGFRKN